MVGRVVHEKIKRRKKEEEIKLCLQRQRLAVCVSATRWGNCTKIDPLLAVKETQKLDNIAHEISDTSDTDSDAITVGLCWVSSCLLPFPDAGWQQRLTVLLCRDSVSRDPSPPPHPLPSSAWKLVYLSPAPFHDGTVRMTALSRLFRPVFFLPS